MTCICGIFTTIPGEMIQFDLVAVGFVWPFFVVFKALKDGRYVTPKSDTILQSTTNIMLQQLARNRGMIVEERPIDFEKEIENFKEVGSLWLQLKDWAGGFKHFLVFIPTW